jgi:hypothetical protein
VSAEFDASEAKALAEVLATAAAGTPEEVRQVVSRGALNIKRDAQRGSRGLKHAPAYPSSITYDISSLPTAISAEIGPDKQRRQGALGNLIEYGSVNNPPRPHIRPAADREQPRFEKALEDLARKPLEGP